MNRLARGLSALWGCWRLAQFDRNGLYGFDCSWHGFRHSYWALALAAPVFLALMGLVEQSYADGSISAKGYVVRLAGFELTWLAYIALSFPLAALLGKKPRALAFITVSNWVQFSVLLANLLALLPSALGWVGADGYQLIIWAYLILASVYYGFSVHVALDTGFWESTGVTLFNIFFSQLGERLFYALFN